MTPQQVMKLRRIETMRNRLKKPIDPHIEQMRRYYALMSHHMDLMERHASRQTVALEAIQEFGIGSKP